MNKRSMRPVYLALVVFLIIFGLVTLFLVRASTKSVTSQSSIEETVNIPQSIKATKAIDLPVSRQIIGGELRVTGAANFSGGISSSTVTIKPSSNTNNVTTGQLYSSADNSLYYYDGQKKINLSSIDGIGARVAGIDGKVDKLTADASRLSTSSNGVATLQGQGGDVVLSGSDGIVIDGTSITNAGVLTVQGKTGKITLSGGSGVSVSGTTISNTGVTSIGSLSGDVSIGSGLAISGGEIVNTGVTRIISGSSDITVTETGTGTYSIGYAGSGVGGTVALGPVVAQQNSSSNPSIWINKTGSGNLLQLSTGSSPVNRFVVDQAGAVTAGSFVGDGAGLTSVNASQLNGQAASFYLNASNLNTGTLTDSRLSGNVVLLDAANNTFSGSINAASFTGNGAGISNVNAAQLNGQAASFYLNASNLNTGTLADTRLSTNVVLRNAATNTFTGSIVANSLSGNGSGVTNVDAVLFGSNAVSYYLNASNMNTGTLSDQRLSSNVALLDATNNLFAGNLTATTLAGSGAGVTNVNALQLGGQSASYYLSANNISAGTLADARLSANIAKFNVTANFTGALQQGGNNVCNTSNNCNYLTGSAASGSYIQLQPSDPGIAQVGNFNITGSGRATTLFQGASQVCDTSGNCTGIGGEITGSGTAGNIAVFSGTGGSLQDSILSQTGTTGVTVAGTLTATTLTGNGAALTGVNASQLNGQSASYYQNATSINAGILADARLSTNVARLDATTNNFSGVLQQGGNAVCDDSNNCNYLTGSSANGAFVQLQSATPGVTQTGSLNISGTVTAASLSGDGAAVTNVNASQLNGQNASYYLNASNINAGTLSDARLSANVAKLNTAANFTAGLQSSGNNVCDDSNNCGYLSGSAASGAYIQLQSTTPGAAQTGNFNITGTGRAASLYQNGNQVCDNSGNCNGLGGAVSGSGTSGTIAMFNSNNSIANSILTQSGTSVTVAGTLAATNLSGAGAGITNVNAASLNGNGASFYQNATNLTAGTLADARLSGNVALLDAGTANFVGTLQQGGNAVCDASNNCNYLTGSAAGSAYIQLQSATPGTAQTGNFNITGTGRATALYQGANQVCDASNNCNYLTGSAASGTYIQLQSGTPGAAQTGNLNISGVARAQTFYQNGNEVCDISGNCPGPSGEITGLGTAGRIAVFSGTGNTLQDSIISQSGSTLTVDGSLSATTLAGNGAAVTNVNALQLGGQSASYYLSASNISAGTLADARLSANIAKLNATANFTGILQQGGNNVCDASNNCNYLTGSAANGAYMQLQATSPGTAQVGNFNITGTGRAASLYQGANQVCDTSGNCTGIGGEITGSGTAGNIAVFSGTGGSLQDSILSQTGTTGIAVAGTLTATTLTGNGAAVTNVNASQLNGQNASYYQNATSINAGTLSDARLSANVAKLDATTNNFTGALQQGGNNVCDASNNCNYLTGSAASGNYVQLQATAPGTAQAGNLNITGAVIAGTLTGNGAAVTNVNASQLNGQNASYYQNATSINAGTLSDARLSANVAKLDATTNNFTGALQQGGNAVCDNSNNCNYLTQLVANDNYIQLQSTTPGAAQTGNFNITGTGRAASLYQNGNQVCDNSGNCNGLGGAVSGSGTSGTIAMFNSNNSIANSILTQSGTSVTVAGTLAATNLSGAGAGITNVNAASLNGNGASFYQNATNLTAGTLADARLSGNVALLSAENTFIAANTFSTSVTTPLLRSAAGLEITGGTTLSLQSTGTNAASLDSGTTGSVSVGTGSSQKVVTIGSVTSASSLALRAGTGGITIGSAGVANTIQIGNTSGAVAQTINIGNNATAGSVSSIVLGSPVGTSPVTVRSGTSGLLVKGSNSATAFNIQNSDSSATLLTVNTINNLVGIGSAPQLGGSTLQVTGTQSVSSDLTVGGRVSVGQSGISINNGSSISSILYGSGGNVVLQNVNIATNNTVKVGGSMGILYTDAQGNISVLDVAGQTGNCAGYNGTAITWQGCSGSGGGSTGFSNGGNGYTNNPGTATSQYGNSTPTTITNPVMGLTGPQVLDIITNNQSRIRIQDNGDVAVQSNGVETSSRFSVRTLNQGNTEQYINTLVVDTASDIGGRVGIGLKVGTTPQVTLDIGGGRNNYGGSGIQVRASYAPGLSASGGQGEDTTSTGRIYYDNTLRKFRVSENGANWSDLVVGGGANPVILGGNTMGGNGTAVIGTLGSGEAVNLQQSGSNRIVLDNSGNILMTPSAGKSINVNGATAESNVALHVNGRIRSSEYASGAYVGMTTANPCNSNEALTGVRIVSGLVVAGSCLSAGSGDPFKVGGNTNSGNNETIFGMTDNSGLNIRQNNSDRIVLDKSGNIKLTAAANMSINVNGANTETGVALNVNGRIKATNYATNGYVGADIGACNGNQAINGMRVVGGIVVGGSCATNNSDLAEAYNSTDGLVAGELVMATSAAATSVSRATGSSEGLLMGIVSTAPGKLIGTEQVPDGYPIALSGRVPTKVNGEGGAIAVGDKITISSVAGVGKKATGSGMVVGTAVEAFSGDGTGAIEVFVNLMHYNPVDGNNIQAAGGTFGSLNVSGETTLANLTVTGTARFNGNIVVNGHIITAGNTPNVAAAAAAGAGAVASVSGNDTAGTVTITTGSSGIAAGDVASLSFSAIFGKTPRVVLSPQSSAGAQAMVYASAKSANGFSVGTGGALAPNTAYSFDYIVIE